MLWIGSTLVRVTWCCHLVCRNISNVRSKLQSYLLWFSTVPNLLTYACEKKISHKWDTEEMEKWKCELWNCALDTCTMPKMCEYYLPRRRIITSNVARWCWSWCSGTSGMSFRVYTVFAKISQQKVLPERRIAQRRLCRSKDPSVCLSVCLSVWHAGIVPERLHP